VSDSDPIAEMVREANTLAYRREPGGLEAADSLLSRALLLDDRSIEVLVSRCRVRVRLGRRAEAREDARAAILAGDLGPSQCLSASFALDGEERRRVLQHGIVCAPAGSHEAVALRRALGWSFMDDGLYQESIAAFAEALSLATIEGDVGRIMVVHHLAIANMLAGRFAEAEELVLTNLDIAVPNIGLLVGLIVKLRVRSRDFAGARQLLGMLTDRCFEDLVDRYGERLAILDAGSSASLSDGALQKLCRCSDFALFLTGLICLERDPSRTRECFLRFLEQIKRGPPDWRHTRAWEIERAIFALRAPPSPTLDDVLGVAEV
jgi:hypothetical protein